MLVLRCVGGLCRVLSPDQYICSADILQGNFKPDFYLKYIQKDLRLAIALGDAVNHPTPMAAAANEVT
jgi:3-hydroxyisobutyrate dehydrogenase-like beta-hydroxyacid dehydrogenase